jgi:hypothetical protein
MIPDAGLFTPETGYKRKGKRQITKRSSIKTNKNKGILRAQISTGLVNSVHCYRNVDAFR